MFTPDTKDAVENCIKKAGYIQDPLPVEEMYMVVPAPPGAKHNLPEYIAMRGESKLEGFHDPLANFGNTNMNESLCDLLNLAGTARYNVTIRHKISLRQQPPEKGRSSQ